MSCKHLTNLPGDAVRESLYGFARIHPNLKVDLENNVVFDAGAENKRRQVGVITGGGSGHEPFPSGYVGSGMLTASVSGAIFASPPPRHILRAVSLTAAKFREVLLLVPNYTGDVLNFGVAAETALKRGIRVESVVVGEDIAQVCHGMETKAGKRGTCGLVIVTKIAGYLADMGASAREVKETCLEVLENMAAMGLCLDACSKPGSGKAFHLNETEIELGVGVHGEPGVERLNLGSASEGVSSLLGPLTSYLKIDEGDEVVVLVNNLGSVTYLEQSLVAGEVEKQLTRKGVHVVRLYAGTFFTSLNMNGIQICILKQKDKNKELVLKALDHPTEASAWPSYPSSSLMNFIDSTVPVIPEEENVILSEPVISVSLVEQCLNKISHDLINSEMELNQLDEFCGDGDCGTTFRYFAEALLTRMKDKRINFTNPIQLFGQLSSCAEENVGGTTGAIYGLFFRGIAKSLSDFRSFDIPLVYGKCWREGVETIKRYSSARLGDRTMLDALETGCETFEKLIAEERLTGLEAFRRAVEDAVKGSEKTKRMTARAGRASYTKSTNQKEEDAGAKAVTIWLSAILKVIEEENFTK